MSALYMQVFSSRTQYYLKVEGSSPSHPVFHVLPAAAREKREKRVLRVPFTLSPRQRSPHPAKGLAAPLNPAFGDFSMALITFRATARDRPYILWPGLPWPYSLINSRAARAALRPASLMLEAVPTPSNKSCSNTPTVKTRSLLRPL